MFAMVLLWYLILVLIKSYYCTYISHIISLTFCLSVAKTREPKDEQLCIAVHTINNNIHVTKPLSNSSIKETDKTALSYIT